MERPSPRGISNGSGSIASAMLWVSRAEGAGEVATVLGAITALALVGAAVYVFARRRNVVFPEALEGALLLTCIPLLSPQGWDYVFLVSTPAIMLLLNYEDRLSPVMRFATIAALATIGLSVYDLMGRDAYGMFMAWSVITICYLVVVGAMWALRSRAIA